MMMFVITGHIWTHCGESRDENHRLKDAHYQYDIMADMLLFDINNEASFSLHFITVKNHKKKKKN